MAISTRCCQVVSKTSDYLVNHVYSQPGVALVWYKMQDMRLHDHSPLYTVHLPDKNKNYNFVIHLFIFDNFWFNNRLPLTNCAKTGVFRTKFLIESISDLRYRFNNILNSQLIVRSGNSDEIINQLCLNYNIKEIHYHSETCYEELNIIKKVQNKVYNTFNTINNEITKQDDKKYYNQPPQFIQHWGGITLYHIDDLPLFGKKEKEQGKEKEKRKRHWKKTNKNKDNCGNKNTKNKNDVRDMSSFPNVFTTFRTRIEKGGKCVIKDPLAIPNKNSMIPHIPVVVEKDNDNDNDNIKPIDIGIIPSIDQICPNFDFAKKLNDCKQRVCKIIDNVSGNNNNNKKFDLTITNNLKGGETYGLQRIEDYIFNTRCVKYYFDTRNGLYGSNFSTKFCFYLSNGNISPRMIHYKLEQFKKENINTLSQSELKSIYWVRFELLWRDFFRFSSMKFGNSIFKYGGPMKKQWALFNDDHEQQEEHKQNEKKEKENKKEKEMRLFEIWKNGETGYPIIDASMKELKFTGYLSNRLRQNVASFLIHDLLIDWRYGAEYFESILIDCDCSSNYGNWNYVAGIGCDPRQHRYFNILSQADRYDNNGDYVKLWLNPLFNKFSNNNNNNNQRVRYHANKDGIFLHKPWEMSSYKQREYGIILGQNYPWPVVQLKGHSVFDTSHDNNKYSYRSSGSSGSRRDYHQSRRNCSNFSHNNSKNNNNHNSNNNNNGGFQNREPNRNYMRGKQWEPNRDKRFNNVGMFF